MKHVYTEPSPYVLQYDDLKLFEGNMSIPNHYSLEGPHLHFYIRVLKQRGNRVTWLIVARAL